MCESRGPDSFDTAADNVHLLDRPVDGLRRICSRTTRESNTRRNCGFGCDGSGFGRMLASHATWR